MPIRQTLTMKRARVHRLFEDGEGRTLSVHDDMARKELVIIHSTISIGIGIALPSGAAASPKTALGARTATLRGTRVPQAGNGSHICGDKQPVQRDRLRARIVRLA
jgi:hypothetical protein